MDGNAILALSRIPRGVRGVIDRETAALDQELTLIKPTAEQVMVKPSLEDADPFAD